MTLSILGGLLMIVGSYLTYKGKIFQSVFVYLFADLIWMTLSFQVGDIYGRITVLLGTLFGLGAFYKMHVGQYRKDILR